MTPREANEDLVAEIRALRDRLASTTRDNAELQRSLAEANHRETATSEILRVISDSPSDVQPVFDAIAANAARLCDAVNGLVIRFDGELLHLAAQYNVDPERLAAVREAYPRPPSRGALSGRAILTRDVVHVPDVSKDPEYTLPAATTIGYRSVVAVPMMHQGVPLGTILVARDVVAPFSDAHIALIQTFADQAVIAIENVRLFNETKEALEQQTATSEVLKVISRSTFDLAPVLHTLVENATRLCGAESGLIWRFDGEVFRPAADYAVAPDLTEFWERNPIRRGRDSVTGRAALERRPVQIPDVLADPEYGLADAQKVGGYRTLLGVPMVREGVLIGVFGLQRYEVRSFTDKQIELVTTFADQAAIAIENVRLFTELQQKNEALTHAHARVSEALEQQTATADILSVISRSPSDTQPVFDAIVQSAVRLCDGLFGTVLRLDGDRLYLAAHHNLDAAGVQAYRDHYPVHFGLRETVASTAVLDRRVVQVIDSTDPAVPSRSVAMARAVGFRGVLVVPMLRDGEPIGVINVARRERGPFTDRQVVLLQTFADQAVIAIENVRLFTELQQKNEALTQAHAQVTEALEQQTATAEILQVISQSPTDVQPVFDVIAARAMTLCDAELALVQRSDGEHLHLAAIHGADPAGVELARRSFPMPLSTDSCAGRAVRRRSVVHLTDVLDDPTYALKEQARSMGFRGGLAVPMVRDEHVIGAVFVGRAKSGLFSDTEVQLLRTFADQAVIAIENVRLFSELRERTAQLGRSVDELTALGQVSQALSSTLDLGTVLTTIVQRAIELSAADGGSVYEYDDAAEEFRLRATQNFEEELVEATRAMPLRRGEGALGMVTERRVPIQIADISDPTAYQSRVRDVLLRTGYRAILAVPLLRDDRIIGGLVIGRKAAGEFSSGVIDVLTTFANQSALAILNARLFREIEQKSRELEAASRHKSEFLANMSHELRTPLNAIIGFSEVLGERMFGELNEKQDEYLKDIHASGQHLLSLINDILDLSKVEAGKMELELSDFDLPMTIDNALMLVRERAARKSIELHSTVDERLGQVQGDERKIRQVLLNLLSNAIKFTPEGGRIDVQARPVDESIEVSIVDTGVGIAPEDQEAVFEEFRQVGTADKKVEGTGLGLTLCRKFIELHGGKIWVKSQVGTGSTFTFTIPVRRGE